MPKMNLTQWLAEYARICKELNISPKEDMHAARLLQSLLKGRKRPGALSRLIKGRPVIIFGAGPSLEKKIKALLPRLREKNRPTLICADGTVSALLQEGITPHIVVTDLDGNPHDIVCASRTAVMIVHAHGDNIPLLKRLVPKLANVIGTTQARPIRGIRNFFGFTDGDRCVSLAVQFGAKSVTLVGMDFGKTQGRYSKGRQKPAGARKLKKLAIAKRLTRLFLSR